MVNKEIIKKTLENYKDFKVIIIKIMKKEVEKYGSKS